MDKLNKFLAGMIIVILLAGLNVDLFSLPAQAASADEAVTDNPSGDSAIFEQPAINETISAAGFVHPAVGFSGESLRLMQQKVAIGAEPWASAFESFRNSSSGSLDYDIRNQSKIDPAKPAYTKVDNDAKAKEAKVDAAAAFTDAVIWAASGDIRYREKAMSIIRLWSQIDPTNPVGFTDSHISIGDAMFNMVRAAELLRYTECEGEWGWTEQDTTNFNQNFLMAFYDGNFYHSNVRWMNQHGIITLAYTMAAVFSDNTSWYKEAVEWSTANKTALKKGQSGDIYHQIRYVTQNERTGEPVEPHVELVEMGRDMGHASGNTSTLSMIAYMTELQGTKVDPNPASPTFGEITNAANGEGLFEFLDNRILAGSNILAQYNLGYDILYTPVNTSNGVIADPAGSYYDSVSDNGRGLGYASEITYGYYTHLTDTPLDPSDERIKYLHQLIEKQGGLAAIPSYILLMGTEDLATGEIKGPPKPLSQPSYSEVKAAYDRIQAFDYLGRSATTSTNTFQDLDGLRSVLYDVRYANQYTWYDLDLDDSYNNITIRAASNSSEGTKVDVILLDDVTGLDRTNVTAADLAKGELLTTLQVPNTGWWTNYATVSGKLSKPLTGQHVIAFKYYGSTNALSYQIAFDWFAFSDSLASNENIAANGVLSGAASTVAEGVQLSDGGTISYNKMNFDSGNNSVELTAKTSDANGKLLLYSGDELITTYSLMNTSGSLIKFTADIAAADIAKITGIHNISLKYVGSSPIVLKTYRNIERNRLVSEETATSSNYQIEDQAISVAGGFETGTEGQTAYVKTTNGSIIYLSQGALQVDRTKDCIVSFTVKSNGQAKLNLKRDKSTAPFAVISVPDTKGEWLRVSTNISSKFVNTADYPTNLKSVFVSMEAESQDTEMLLDSYALDPAETPPIIQLSTTQGYELQSVVAYENGNPFHLQVSVQDPDSVNVALSTDNQKFMESSLNGKNGGEITINPAGLIPGEYNFHIYAQDDSGNFVDREFTLTLYSELENHAPTDLTATLTGPDSASLHWTEVKGATYYSVYRKQGTNGTFTKVNDTTATDFTDSNLLAGTTYYYKVAAGGYSGESPQSQPATVTTLSPIAISTSMVTATTNAWPGTGTPEQNGWLAFDGNTATATDTITNPGWILIDLGAGNEQVPGGVKFYPRSTNISRMNGAVIQGSNDGTNFTDLYSISGISTAKWYFVEIGNNTATAYRYLRYYSPKGNANVAELAFYAKAGVTVNTPPVFGALEPASIHSGQTLTQNITATDEDGDVITYSGMNLPAGAILDAATGAFSWTPDTVGEYVLEFKATDSGGAESSTTWYVTVTDKATPEADHSASLSGPAEAAPGQAVNLNIGIHGVPEGFSTVQLAVYYDPSRLEFPTMENNQGQLVLADNAVESPEAGVQIIGTGVKPELGQMLIIVATTATENLLTDSDSLIVLHGQAKAAAASGAASVSLHNFEVSREGESSVINTSQATLNIQIKVDKSVLMAAISSAQTLYDAAVEGSEAGQYPVGSKAKLLTAIGEADVVANNEDATQSEADTAAAVLKEAVRAFTDAVIGVNKTELQQAIQQALDITSTAVVGSAPGQYPAVAKTAFDAAIQSAAAVRDNSVATQYEVNEAVAALGTAIDAFRSSVNQGQNQPADKTALDRTIQSIQAKLNKAVSGTKIGQYPAQAISALQAVLNTAKTVKANAAAAQTEVDAAIRALQTAAETFSAQLITLVRGETQVSLKDLSLIAKYYGMKSTDANWSEIEKADLFGTGEISIRELAAVAQMIVADWLAK